MIVSLLNTQSSCLWNDSITCFGSLLYTKTALVHLDLNFSVNPPKKVSYDLSEGVLLVFATLDVVDYGRPSLGLIYGFWQM